MSYQAKKVHFITAYFIVNHMICCTRGPSHSIHTEEGTFSIVIVNSTPSFTRSETSNVYKSEELYIIHSSSKALQFKKIVKK